MASCAAGCVAPRPRGSGRARGGAPASAALPLRLSSAPVTSAGSARPPRVSLVPFVRASLPTGQKRTRSQGDFSPGISESGHPFSRPRECGDVQMFTPRGRRPSGRPQVQTLGEILRGDTSSCRPVLR